MVLNVGGLVKFWYCPEELLYMGTECTEHNLCKNQSAYKNIFLLLQARQHRKFAVEEGDHLTMLNVYEAFVKVSQFKCMWLC